MPETNQIDQPVSSVCHWMPCSISYDGLAPIQMLFHPEPVVQQEDQKHQDQLQETAADGGNVLTYEDESGLSPSKPQAASFRGRGLLARNTHKIPEGFMGSVLLPSEADKSRLHKGNSFTEILEWEHEWDTNRLIVHSERDEREVHNESSIEKSLALMDLLRAVHEPIPIEE